MVRLGQSYSAILSRNQKWRRGELNPCPRRCPRKHLHVYPALRFKEPTLHRRTAVSRASTKFLHRPTRSLRRTISLLSTFPAVAGVQPKTSRSIKPRERDLGDLRLFVLVRFFTRPTNHPRHAACASNNKSKPVRPLFLGPTNLLHVKVFSIHGPQQAQIVGLIALKPSYRSILQTV